MITEKFKHLILTCLLLHSYEVVAGIVPLDKPQVEYCTNETTNSKGKSLTCFKNDEAIKNLQENQRQFLNQKLLLISATKTPAELESIFNQPPLNVGRAIEIPFQGISYKSQSFTWWAGNNEQLPVMERLKIDGSVVVQIVNGLVLTATVNYGVGKFLKIEYASSPCVMNCK